MPISSFCEECNREYLGKGWLKKNYNCGRSSVLTSPLPWDPMVTKRKKKKKTVKVKRSNIFGKWKILSGDMVNSYLSTTFGVNSHDLSEKTRFTDGWTDEGTTDAHAMALALLTRPGAITCPM